MIVNGNTRPSTLIGDVLNDVTLATSAPSNEVFKKFQAT